MSGVMATTVSLSEEERQKLRKMVKEWQLCPTITARCQILLLADKHKGMARKDLATLCGTSLSTVSTVMKLYRTGGVAEATRFNRKEASDVARLTVDGRTEAIIIAQACLPPPPGRVHWTLRLLASTIEQNFNIGVSKDTVRRALNRNELKPHRNKYWCIPPKENPEFVAYMEDVLDVYERPYDSDYPVVCIDEKSYQLLDEVREPKPMVPGHSATYDSEYKRMGTCSLFMVNEPLAGQRRVFVNATRGAADFASIIKQMCDEMYPDAKRIVLVMDNLNTHSVSSLYKVFSPAEARRLYSRLEIHNTPKHGSWLDMAEIELNVLNRQCLNRRIPNVSLLAEEISAWEKERNSMRCKIDWHFTAANARVKLKSLYPKLIPIGDSAVAPTPVPVSNFDTVSKPEQYAKPEVQNQN